MEVLNLLNTNPELLNGLVYGPEGKNWEKLQVKKTCKVLMDTKKHSCQDGTLVTTDLYINENVTDEQIAQSKKD